jgi:uncharacterized membrane-anchored protein
MPRQAGGAASVRRRQARERVAGDLHAHRRRNEEGERLLDRGVADLYRNGNGNGDAIAFIASHSVYQELGFVVSRLDQVGDQIQNIVIDHV